MKNTELRKKSNTEYSKEILALADEMASNISSLNNHTYESFIASRDKLEETLKEAFPN
jgi:hypothetical protein